VIASGPTPMTGCGGMVAVPTSYALAWRGMKERNIMLRRVSELSGYEFQAIDGKLGTVSDLLFDDETWKTRWVVVGTGGWLIGRRLLIHPSSIGQPDDGRRLLPVNMTKAQIEASPDVLQDLPVSRQMEINLYDYYGCDPMWGVRDDVNGAIASPMIAPSFFGNASLSDRNEGDARMNEGDPHLRSVAAVTGYHIHAADGDIGHVESFLVDDQGWGIGYLVIDTRNWRQGDHVLVAPAAVTEIDWFNRKVHLRVTREQVRASAAWQAAVELPQKDWASLYSHQI
jgi:hypothetical protein